MCVCVLLWVICGGSNVGGRCTTGTLMWARWEGWGEVDSPQELKVPFFLRWPLLPFCLFCTQYILQIHFRSPSFHFLPLRNRVILLCTMFTNILYIPPPHSTSNKFIWNKNKIGFCYYITFSHIPSRLHWFLLFPVSSGGDVSYTVSVEQGTYLFLLWSAELTSHSAPLM